MQMLFPIRTCFANLIRIIPGPGTPGKRGAGYGIASRSRIFIPRSRSRYPGRDSTKNIGATSYLPGS
eukprot:scaffold1961_cov157-Chaetoceros_neogracile.AAC.1